MKKHDVSSYYQDYFEYHGNTEVKRIRKKAGDIISRDWLVFDSVEEAMEYFNTRCGEFIVQKMPAWMIQEAVSS